MTPLVHVSSRYPASRHCLAAGRAAGAASGAHRRGDRVRPRHRPDRAAGAGRGRHRRPRVHRARRPARGRRADRAAHRARQPRAGAGAAVGAQGRRPGAAATGSRRAAWRIATSCAPSTAWREKVRRVFQRAADLPPPDDPELALYGGGFLPDADKRLLAEVRATPPEQLATRAFPFRDPRYPSCCSATARATGRTRSTPRNAHAGTQFRRDRLTRPTPLTGLTLDDYFARLDRASPRSALARPPGPARPAAGLGRATAPPTSPRLA